MKHISLIPLGDARFTPAAAGNLTHALKALASGPRLYTLALLAQFDELTPLDVEPYLDLAQPTVSHHMKALHGAGLVRRRKRGVNTFYRLNPQTLTAVADALAPAGKSGATRARIGSKNFGAAAAEALAADLGVLASPPRLRILSLLCTIEEATVGEIGDHAVQLTQSMTSFHVGKLTDARLLTRRQERNGRKFAYVHCSLNRNGIGALAQAIRPGDAR